MRELTYDLLVSIFQPTSPLHDGAVIVQGDRVAAAACFLPLTVNPAVQPRSRLPASRRARRDRGERRGRRLSCRRRPAVSRWSIDGAIERNLDAERLRARLKSLVTFRRAGKPPRRDTPELMASFPSAISV